MRAITIMYDSLIRKFLEPYGCDFTITPNFQRLAQKACCFDKFYAASMPCIPARRELQTGRINFLHRSWGPMEPFDDSVPALLSQNGIHTHMISDHVHYWQDGALNYHTKFTTHEFIRGQEGDAWKADTSKFEGNSKIRVQDKINREYMKNEEEHYHVRMCNSALEFLELNEQNDNWYLHLEYFDPHEPFFAPDRFKEMYEGKSTDIDWPPYKALYEENRKDINNYRNNYFALLTMCDEYLGKILDFMDEHNMWDDTMLILNTDHGYLFGEHGYYAKNTMPCYEEISHLPFFIHVPNCNYQLRNENLAQTLDVPATILDYFNIDKPKDMQGKSLIPCLTENASVRDYAIFGYFGRHINVTDGKYVYYKAAVRDDNSPLYNYTLMPQHLWQDFSIDELSNTEEKICKDFEFTKGIGVLKIPVSNKTNPTRQLYDYQDHLKFGDLLFNVDEDPEQNTVLNDAEVIERLKTALKSEMESAQAPEEQFIRLGL